MAYVSSLTSGGFNWQFNEPLLTEQAIKESTCPIKKYLDEIFEGKQCSSKNAHSIFASHKSGIAIRFR